MYRNDQPTLDDQLGRAGLVKSLGDALATCEPPHVFGVHGDWGAGKTSFLHQLHLYLTGTCPEGGLHEEGATNPRTRKTYTEEMFGSNWKPAQHVVVVWFEAWRYQQEAAPIVALLQEIRAQLPLYAKCLNQAGKIANVAIRGALLSLEDLTKKIGFQASKIEQAGQEWEQSNLAMQLPSHVIREQLEAALHTLIKETKSEDINNRTHPPRIVILIDDLDRCESDTAYALLEGIHAWPNSQDSTNWSVWGLSNSAAARA